MDPLHPFRPLLESAHRRRHSWAAAILACGLAATIDRVATIEWSYPYCNDPQDGSASALFGAPFPYERWNGVSSLEYEFAPHLYLLNILLLSIVLYPVLRPAVVRLGQSSQLRHRILRSAGVLLLLGNLTLASITLTAGRWQPVRGIAHPPYDTYAEFRPVGVTRTRHYECSPSTFWFGPVQSVKRGP